MYKRNFVGGQTSMNDRILASRNTRNRAAQLVATTLRRNARFVQNRVRVVPSYVRPFQMKGELKSVDVAIAKNYQITSTPPVAQYMNGTATGSGYFQHIGLKIQGKSIHLRGFVQNLVTSVQGMGRIVVVFDKQTNGVLPTWAEVMANRDNAGATANGYQAEVNLDNRDRFVILRDYEHILPSCTNTAGVMTNQFPQNSSISSGGKECNELSIDLFIKLKGLETTYGVAGTAAIGDCKTGGIFLFCVASTNDASYSFAGSSRYRYTDV